MKRIGILGVQGLPASYGAFEQTAHQIIVNSDFKETCFYVSTTTKVAKQVYEHTNVIRVSAPRFGGLGVIIYGLICFVKMYCRGVRCFIFFGYGLSPFFWAFKLLGCRIICNVDGFEWRREKWGEVAKHYFKICEHFAAKSADIVVVDSKTIYRYYRKKYGVLGRLVYYGADVKNGESNALAQHGLEAYNYYVCVQRLEPENSISEIVDAFLIANQERQLIIIGPSTKYFTKKVLPKIESSSGKVVWLGPIYNRNDLIEIRKNAFGYVHGHTVGGVNPTLVEAFDIKVPIIAKKTKFNREVAINKAVYFKNVEQLRSILENGQLIQVDTALSQEFTWPIISKQYLKFVEELS